MLLFAVQKKRNLVKILLPITALVLLITFTTLVLTYKHRGKKGVIYGKTKVVV